MVDRVKGAFFAGMEVPLIVALRHFFNISTDNLPAFNREVVELSDDELEWFHTELQGKGYRITNMKLLKFKKINDDGVTYEETPKTDMGYKVGDTHPAVVAKQV